MRHSLARLTLLAAALVLSAAALHLSAADTQPSTGSVKGTVVDNNGKAAADCVIILQQSAQKMRDPIQGTTDTDGAFKFDNVPEGDYTLHARTRDAKLSARKSVTVVAGNTTNAGKLTLASRRR